MAIVISDSESRCKLVCCSRSREAGKTTKLFQFSLRSFRNLSHQLKLIQLAGWLKMEHFDFRHGLLESLKGGTRSVLP